MDLDKSIENFLRDEDRKYSLEQAESEVVWDEIKKNTSVNRKWYEKLLIKLSSKRKLIVDCAAVALAALIIFIIPVAIINYNSNHRNVPSSNNSKLIKNNKNNDDRKTDKNNTGNKQIINSDDQPPEDIYNLVDKQAKSLFQKYTIYYEGKIKDERLGTDEQCYFEVFENRTDTKTPQVKYYVVDTVTKVLKDWNDVTGSSSCVINTHSIWPGSVENLIAKIEGIDSKEITQGEDESIYQYTDKKTDTVTYYQYDESTGQLYKISNADGAKDAIYKFDPDSYSILTVEQKIDLNGDGTEEDIKIDPLRSIISINGISVETECGVNFGFGTVKLNSNSTEIYTYQWVDAQPEYCFFRYKDGLIYKNGKTHGEKLIANGDNKIIVKRQLQQFFESWLCDSELTLNSNQNLVESNKKDFYRIPSKYDESSEQCGSEYQRVTVKIPITLYKDKDSSEIAAKLKAGDTAYIIGTDKKAWVLAQDKNGVQGWFAVQKPYTIKEANKSSEQVFDGLFFGQ